MRGVILQAAVIMFSAAICLAAAVAVRCASRDVLAPMAIGAVGAALVPHHAPWWVFLSIWVLAIAGYGYIDSRMEKRP